MQIILHALSNSDKQNGGAHPYLAPTVVENLLEFDFGESQAFSTFWWIRIIENNRSLVGIGYDDPMGTLKDGRLSCGPAQSGRIPFHRNNNILHLRALVCTGKFLANALRLFCRIPNVLNSASCGVNLARISRRFQCFALTVALRRVMSRTSCTNQRNG